MRQQVIFAIKLYEYEGLCYSQRCIPMAYTETYRNVFVFSRCIQSIVGAALMQWSSLNDNYQSIRAAKPLLCQRLDCTQENSVGLKAKSCKL